MVPSPMMGLDMKVGNFANLSGSTSSFSGRTLCSSPWWLVYLRLGEVPSSGKCGDLSYASQVSGALGCNFAKEGAEATLMQEITAEGASISKLFKGISSLANLNLAVDPTLSGKISAALKKDDSVMAHALAYLATAALPGDVPADVYDTIEDVAHRSDTIGAARSFDDGLMETAMFLKGALVLSQKQGKAALSGDMVKGFAAYITSNKNKASQSSLFYTLIGLDALSNNNLAVPTSLSVSGGSVISGEGANFQVVLVNPLGEQVTGSEASIQSAVVPATGAALFKTGPMDGGNGAFSVSPLPNPARGVYSVGVTGSVPDGFVAPDPAKFKVKVVLPVTVEGYNLKIVDVDDNRAMMTSDLSGGAAVAKVDLSSRLTLDFNIADSAGKVALHQVFVRFTNTKTQQTVYFVAQADLNKRYSLDVNFRTAAAKSFGGVAGDYSVDLILGDATLASAVVTNIATLTLDLAESKEVLSAPDKAAKPEITHVFRQPEKRPPQAISSLFTGLVLLPALVVLGVWAKLGANLSGFSFSLSGLGFHLGLLAVLGIYVHFFLGLIDMSMLHLLLLLVPLASTSLPRGANLANAASYTGPQFKCADGSQSFPLSYDLSYASQVSGALGCNFAKEGAEATLMQEITAEGASISKLFKGISSLANLNLAVDPTLSGKISAALKKDDSVMAHALAYLATAALPGDVPADVYDTIEDVAHRSDTIGAARSFDDGLMETAMFLKGALVLSQKQGKAALSGDMVKGFAAYITSNKNKASQSSLFYTLIGLDALSNNNLAVPTSLSVSGGSVISGEGANFQVFLVNPLGEQVTGSEASIQSAVVPATGAALFKTGPMEGGNGAFSVSPLPNPARGVYSVGVTGSVPDGFVAPDPAKFKVKVVLPVTVEGYNLKIVDVDDNRAMMTSDLSGGAAVAKVDLSSRLTLDFNIADSAGKVALHQVFVRFTNTKTQQTVYFVAQADLNKRYSLDVNFRTAAAKSFGGVAGDYSVDLILGDATLASAVVTNIATLTLDLAESKEVLAAPDKAAKPEITHVFRQPEKRPPQAISSLFTGLVLLPALVVLGVWAKLGANLSGFSFSLSGLGFHLGLLAVLGIYVHFFLGLIDMFATMKWLAIVSLFTFLTGNRLLASIAAKRKEKK
eukprot:sb/3461317/